MTLNGLAQMGDWVGREVRVAAPAWFDGSPVTLSPDPAAGADRAELVVRDSSGREVQRLILPLSRDPIDWAGMGGDGAPLPTGLYDFTIESRAGEEILQTAPVEIYASVTEVQSTGGGLRFVLPGGVTVEGSAVTALRAG